MSKDQQAETLHQAFQGILRRIKELRAESLQKREKWELMKSSRAIVPGCDKHGLFNPACRSQDYDVSNFI